VEEQAFGIVVEAEGSDCGLKFNSVSCGGFGLAKAGQLIFTSSLEVAIKVQVTESAFKRRIIAAEWMILAFGDFASPGECGTAKARDNEEDLLFVRNVGVGTHIEGEGALGHKVTEFGDFAGEFRWRGDFRVLTIGSWRSTRGIVATELSNFFASSREQGAEFFDGFVRGWRGEITVVDGIGFRIEGLGTGCRTSSSGSLGRHDE